MNLNMTHSSFDLRWKFLRTPAVVFIALMAAVIAAAAQQTNRGSGLNYDTFKIVAERNIFNQNRQPHERVVPAPRVPDSFSLVGTLLYAGGDIAFFNGTSDEYRKALKVGGDIAGFKVAGITPGSVTLAEGTNRTVLKVPTQMRREDGRWSVSTEPVAYSSAGSLSGGLSESTPSIHSRSHLSTRSNSPTAGTTPDVSAPHGGSGSVLEQLMQRRAQQEKQLKHGQ